MKVAGVDVAPTGAPRLGCREEGDLIQCKQLSCDTAQQRAVPSGLASWDPLDNLGPLLRPLWTSVSIKREWKARHHPPLGQHDPEFDDAVKVPEQPRASVTHY